MDASSSQSLYNPHGKKRRDDDYGTTLLPSCSSLERDIHHEDEDSISRAKTISNQEHADDTQYLAFTKWQAICTTMSIIIGTALLNLPIALATSGWVCGLSLLCFAAAIMSYTGAVLVTCIEIVQLRSSPSLSGGEIIGYEAIANEALSPSFAKPGWKWITQSLVYFSLVTIASGYLNLSWTYIRLVGSSRGQAWAWIGCWIFTSGVHLLFRARISRRFVFMGLSLVNLALGSWIEALVVGDAISPSADIHPSLPSEFYSQNEEPELFRRDENLNIQWSYRFAFILMAFFCHPVIPFLVHHSMILKPIEQLFLPGAARSPRASFPTMLGCVSAGQHMIIMSIALTFTGLFLPICVMTYAVYGHDLQVPVFLNLENLVVRNITILSYVMHLLLSYVLTLVPVSEALVPASLVSRTRLRVDFGVSTCVYLYSLVFRCSSQVNFFLLIIPMSTLGLICPSLFYLKLCWEELTLATKILNIGIIALGSWCLVFGFYAAAYVAWTS